MGGRGRKRWMEKNVLSRRNHSSTQQLLTNREGEKTCSTVFSLELAFFYYYRHYYCNGADD